MCTREPETLYWKKNYISVPFHSHNILYLFTYSKKIDNMWLEQNYFEVQVLKTATSEENP